MALLSNKSWEQWLQEYECSHQHPANRRCHLVGIPLIALSLLLLPLTLVFHGVFTALLLMFALGWLLQFVGHGFERKPPEFFRDLRFLFVGLRWWYSMGIRKADDSNKRC